MKTHVPGRAPTTGSLRPDTLRCAQQGSFAYVIIIDRLILKINNDGLPSEYMGLPPCLQALHPGIPDETSATRSIIRSFHVMIISRGRRGRGVGRGRKDYANYVAITIYSRDQRLSRLPVNYI